MLSAVFSIAVILLLVKVHNRCDGALRRRSCEDELEDGVDAGNASKIT
jgi:hypothetical protein